jgi:Cu(I)/Ag(I) efflux system membrane fusion protein
MNTTAVAKAMAVLPKRSAKADGHDEDTMKTLVKIALVALMLVAQVSAAELRAANRELRSEALTAVVGSYLEIQAQLAADKFDGIKPPSAAIAAKAGALGKEGAAIAKAAKAVEGAKDIAAAREAFGPLSDAVIAAARAEGFKELKDVKVAFCPMVKKSWLQKGEEMRNPYYGAAMSTCGEFKQ